jgi:hypothetical protein
MITSFDDYPIHQTEMPIAHTASGDPNHYDRYFFNGYSRSGNLFFAAAMGLYPNRSVMDASFSVVRGGEQINLHASARAPFDRMKCTEVGPIKVDVLEPMKRHRLLIDSPEHGLRADLTYTATSAPYEEPKFTQHAGVRVIMNYTRLTQLGVWDGWLEIDGDRINIHHDDIVGSRDRSWGIRNVGERVQLGAPASTPQLPQFFWLWAPVCFDGFGTMFDINEFANGDRWHEAGAFVIGDDTVRQARRVDYNLVYRPGTRHMQSFELTYTFGDGQASLVFEPILHFQMFGLGYLSPDWVHGAWKGELEVGGDRWKVPVEDPTAAHHIHVQTLSNVTLKHTDGNIHRGVGVLETLVLGAHAPSGFTGIADGAS